MQEGLLNLTQLNSSLGHSHLSRQGFQHLFMFLSLTIRIWIRIQFASGYGVQSEFILLKSAQCLNFDHCLAGSVVLLWPAGYLKEPRLSNQLVWPSGEDFFFAFL
jgi:hypothetical protein